MMLSCVTMLLTFIGGDKGNCGDNEEEDREELHCVICLASLQEKRNQSLDCESSSVKP